MIDTFKTGNLNTRNPANRITDSNSGRYVSLLLQVFYCNNICRRG